MEPQIPGGYILTARLLLKSTLMGKPPLWMKLWIWMLLMASHKEHKNLKKGQFFTSSTKMREAMAWKVGARIERPTIKQIRSAYERFTKDGMIGITKVTGGMIITVLNYEHYQTPDNYEGRTERQYEKPTKSHEGAHHNNKNGNKNGNTTNQYSSESDEVRLSELLFSLIVERNPKHRTPNFQAWAAHIDRMIRLDKRTPEEIEKVILWSQADGFWQNNILSTDKLRKQFDTLWLKMQPTGNQRAIYEPNGNNGQPWPEIDEIPWLASQDGNDDQNVPSPRAIHG